jgi:hypothetical protein
MENTIVPTLPVESTQKRSGIFINVVLTGLFIYLFVNDLGKPHNDYYMLRQGSILLLIILGNVLSLSRKLIVTEDYIEFVYMLGFSKRRVEKKNITGWCEKQKVIMNKPSEYYELFIVTPTFTHKIIGPNFSNYADIRVAITYNTPPLGSDYPAKESFWNYDNISLIVNFFIMIWILLLFGFSPIGLGVYVAIVALVLYLRNR